MNKIKLSVSLKSLCEKATLVIEVDFFFHSLSFPEESEAFCFGSDRSAVLSVRLRGAKSRAKHQQSELTVKNATGSN